MPSRFSAQSLLLPCLAADHFETEKRNSSIKTFTLAGLEEAGEHIPQREYAPGASASLQAAAGRSNGGRR